MPLKVDRVVDRIRAMPRTPNGDRRLSAMLRQDGAHFAGLSTADAEWVRGLILAAFEHRAAPDAALPTIKEELRTSLNPVVLAGAARAVRGLATVDGELRTLLAAASERIALGDEYVCFDDAEPGSPTRTAREEIAAALAHVVPMASTCCATGPSAGQPADSLEALSLCPGALSPVTLEDQFGEKTRLVEVLRSRSSLVAFFYTRCMNPAKCSLTVTRLAALARHLRDDGRSGDLNVLAISYDGEFDVSSRLLDFGRDRGFPFDETAKIVRCVAGWSAVRQQFGLQVGYGGSTVNAHARELFMVSTDLRANGLDIELLAQPDVLATRLLG